MTFPPRRYTYDPVASDKRLPLWNRGVIAQNEIAVCTCGATWLAHLSNEVCPAPTVLNEPRDDDGR